MEKKKVFVIMPFQDQFFEVYEKRQQNTSRHLVQNSGGITKTCQSYGTKSRRIQ